MSSLADDAKDGTITVKILLPKAKYEEAMDAFRRIGNGGDSSLLHMLRDAGDPGADGVIEINHVLPRRRTPGERKVDVLKPERTKEELIRQVMFEDG